MRSFTDTEGREWQLNITVLTVKRVKEETGVLLTGIFADGCKLMGELSVDVVKLVEVLRCVCESQAVERGVDADQFAESLARDALGNAGMALMRSVADFFPNQDQRDGLNEIIDKLETAGLAMAKEAKGKVQRIDANLLAKSYTDSALSSPELQASLPGTSP